MKALTDDDTAAAKAMEAMAAESIFIWGVAAVAAELAENDDASESAICKFL